MKYLSLLLCAPLISFIFAGCLSVPLHPRSPTSTEASHDSHVHHDQVQFAKDAELIARFDGSPGELRDQVLNEIRSMTIVAGVTQKLAGGFDLMIQRLAAKRQTVDSATLQTSQLKCDLWENSFFAELSEDRLKMFQEEMLKKSDDRAYVYFLNYFKATKGDTAAEIMAKAQLIRSLKNHHEEFCQSSACPAFIEFQGKPNAPFDPFNDKDMLAFKNKNISKIAVGNAEALFRKTGDCYDSSAARAPNAVEAYPWKQRNHTGKTLQKGQFIVTYDDGPSPKFTESIAAEWAASGLAKPAFFWLGENAGQYPNIVDKVFRQGFEVASHSYSHPDIGNLSKAGQFSDLSKVNRKHFASDQKMASGNGFAAWKESMLDKQIMTSTKTISEVVEAQTGWPYAVKRFRLPFGSGVGNAGVGARLAKLDVNHYFWAVDSLDWQDKNPASVLERVQTQMKLVGRGIILFHDIHKQSLAATKLLIQETKGDHAIQFVTFDDVGL